MAAADTLYEIITMFVKKGPLSYMGVPDKEDSNEL